MPTSLIQKSVQKYTRPSHCRRAETNATEIFCDPHIGLCVKLKQYKAISLHLTKRSFSSCILFITNACYSCVGVQ